MSTASRRLSSILLSVLILAIPLVAWLERDALFDAYRLHNFQPSSDIVQLANQDTMTDYSRHLFYVYHPALEDKETFNSHCSDSEKTIVLGCYILHRGIYLYKVDDARLEGVEQVTAAHEMLHAAYDRLSPSDKKHVDDMINQAYANISDTRIRSTIDSYKKSGADITDELHSILGTEVTNLPAGLEQYYSKYFKDRKTIAAFSEHYEGAFSERQAQAQTYITRLNQLKQQIDSLNSELKGEKVSLDDQYQQLQSERPHVTDVDSFNARVRDYNTARNNYNAKVDQVSALIDQYNTIVKAYDALIGEEQQLYKAIDSRPATVQSQ